MGGAGSGFGAESFRSRLQSVGRAAEAAELSRVTRALNELSQRIEAAEHRSTLAISGIDQQVMGVLSRIEDGERDAGATAARFDGALDEVRAAQEKIAARLARVDAEDAPRVEAMKSLEAALARMAAQIYEGESRARAQAAEAREGFSSLSDRVERAEAAAAEAAGAADAKAFEAALARMTERLDAAEAKTSAAVAALETSFASLDARTKARREATSTPASHSWPTDLQAKVEGDRAGMADRLRAAAADPKLDRMEVAPSATSPARWARPNSAPPPPSTGWAMRSSASPPTCTGAWSGWRRPGRRSSIASAARWPSSPMSWKAAPAARTTCRPRRWSGWAARSPRSRRS